MVSGGTACGKRGLEARMFQFMVPGVSGRYYVIARPGQAKIRNSTGCNSSQHTTRALLLPARPYLEFPWSLPISPVGRE